MRRSLTLFSFLAILLFVNPLFAQRDKTLDVPDIPFDSVPDFLRLPDGLYFGEAVGVATNSKGHVFVFTRGNHTRLFEFDRDGTFIREIGRGLYAFAFAHVVRVDPQDNVWVVDEGTNMIVKFDPAGRVVMLLGRRPEPTEGTIPVSYPPPPAGPTQPYLFYRPTDVVWSAVGDILVADGYGNSRIVKYDKNGRFIKSVGTAGAQPGEFNTPHTMATDAKGNIYVGDRGNRRIQVFDSDLNLVRIYDNVGAPWAICVTPGPHQYLYSGTTSEIYKMELDGRVLGKFGKAGKLLKEFNNVHQIDCRNDNELLVGENETWRVQKLILHPGGR